MAKKFYVLVILIMGCLVTAEAQEDGKVTVRGTVIDSQTGQPIPFANLGLLGTVAGVASDMDGNFELTVPDKYSTHVIRVTAVGYAHTEMKVYEGKDKPELQIKLRPVTYGIGEVDVYGQLLVYKKMLQNVVSNIHLNYISRPYNYDGYFKYSRTEDGQEKVKEAIVKIYDARGYERVDVAEAFKNLNYNFSEVRRNHAVTSVWDGLTCFDDLLTADIVRNTRNVLDITNSRDYKLKSKGKLVYEGDSVQVISYEVVAPALSTTGDVAVKKYSGEIYINLKDLAVLKNVTNITSADFNSLGRNLVAINEPLKNDVKITLTTTYKKLKSVYFLSGATIEYSYKEAETGKDVKGKMEYITTRVDMENPTVIEGRQYYEDIKMNEKFWDRYSVYFEE